MEPNALQAYHWGIFFKAPMSLWGTYERPPPARMVNSKPDPKGLKLSQQPSPLVDCLSRPDLPVQFLYPHLPRTDCAMLTSSQSCLRAATFCSAVPRLQLVQTPCSLSVTIATGRSEPQSSSRSELSVWPPARHDMALGARYISRGYVVTDNWIKGALLQKYWSEMSPRHKCVTTNGHWHSQRKFTFRFVSIFYYT